MVQQVSEKVSELATPSVVEQDFVIPVGDPGVASYQLRKDRLEPRFNVMDYGATGLGVADETAAFTLVLAAAALVGGTVFIPKGSYILPALALPSGVTLEGEGEASVIKNCRLTCTGTVGSEIAFTGAASAGANSIAIPATGLTNSWLRIASVINSNSPDAGVNQLGEVAADETFLAEFVRVKTGNAGTADLYRRTIFPYSNTAGGDSGSFTTSVARVVTFHQGSRIRNLKFLGKASGQNDIICATWCKGLIVENCLLDSNDETAQNIRLDYCLDCHVRGGAITGKLTSVPAGSTANQLIIASSQDCSAHGVSFEGGNQCVDVTYVPNSTYRGGPSINCGAADCRAYNAATEGFTSHPGCWRSFFDNCDADGSTQGIRIRSRGDRVSGCRASSRQGTGAGVLVMDAALFDCDVSHNRLDGFVYGIEFRSSSTGYDDLRATLGHGQALLQSNTISNTSSEGIICAASPALATLMGPRILDNTIYNPGGDGIEVAAYVNGTTIDRNRIFGIATGQRGIRWAANIKRLWIGKNHVFNVHASGFAMGGPSTASMMTDATTFPGGEAEAELFIDQELFTDAATPLTGILRVSAAYLQPIFTGWQPLARGIGSTAPTLQMSSMGFYFSGTEVFGRSLDTAGAVNRTYVMVLSGSADPTAGGGVAAASGLALYLRSSTGVLYTKTGAAATDWTVVGTQT